MTNTLQNRAEKFKNFHEANPHVYDLLVANARLVKKHTKRWGIRNLWEKLRWDYATQVTVTPLKGDYKLNDHYPPFYARMMIRDFPEFEGWLEIRGQNCALPNGV